MQKSYSTSNSKNMFYLNDHQYLAKEGGMKKRLLTLATKKILDRLIIITTWNENLPAPIFLQ